MGDFFKLFIEWVFKTIVVEFTKIAVTKTVALIPAKDILKRLFLKNEFDYQKATDCIKDKA
ncbi:hypothetical protein ERICIV_02983 [Paenibacillus larvae subsp. larvae]|uniref:Uncharacterized protein n=1 Tax=Paenibacillus larvae subsp. larvae TaxID=147375 RepID=A0A2L1UG05_9BACL|nr:hypothetical protein [Paenibacillus larvae]AQT83829.1 hypothetical protein B1222_04510 [Paenibacillus larvae subsp. pulvifaciens]AQZ45264.1 hypothetical protein B5S25_00340 [Paenibacillus larvae subsp. pulvifaciens]AVF27207.1 hypothetical protein ERICIII_03080 [Paenibacillus larvae subsp. larvae]AVF31870.1 hypothetical protein ERICIV_02983 [Paenibacillus larvae subsp. larvae]MBH0343290.1 hypothetical protein [Paenibacillus larvae]